MAQGTETISRCRLLQLVLYDQLAKTIAAGTSITDDTMRERLVERAVGLTKMIDRLTDHLKTHHPDEKLARMRIETEEVPDTTPLPGTQPPLNC